MVEPVESKATSEVVALMLDRGEVLTTLDLCDDPFAYASAMLSHVARRRRPQLVDRVADMEDDLLAEYGA